jgi:hypothetical protein
MAMSLEKELHAWEALLKFRTIALFIIEWLEDYLSSHCHLDLFHFLCCSTERLI